MQQHRVTKHQNQKSVLTAANIASEDDNDEAAWWIPDLQAPLALRFPDLGQCLTKCSSVSGNVALIKPKEN